MQFKRPRKEDARIEITPLVDMVFLLLTFFMLSTTFIVTPGIKVNLPRASAEKVTREKKEVRLVISKDNKIFLEKTLVTLQQLQRKLAGVAQKNPQTLVVIQADAGALHGTVVEVMDTAKTSGLNRLAIATKPKEREGESR